MNKKEEAVIFAALTELKLAILYMTLTNDQIIRNRVKKAEGMLLVLVGMQKKEG